MTNRFDAIVIGAGTNGLAAAAVLARGGKHVLVLERADSVGGMQRTIEFAPGYRAPLSPDAGWLSPGVARGAGVKAPAMTQPRVSISAPYDGGFLSLPTDPKAAAEVIGRHSTRDADRWPAFVHRLAKLTDFLGALYQLPAPDVAATSLSDLASLVGVGRKFRALGRDDMTELLRVLPMSVQDLLDDEFDNAALKAAIGAGGVRDIRQGPRSGGTTFVLLHYLLGAPLGSVRARGWWTGAPDALVVAIEAAARKRRVTIRTGAEVARIEVRNEAVTGVVLANGEEIAAPIVVSSADPRRTFALVDPVWIDPEFLLALRNIRYRGCTAIVQFALDALPESASLGAAELSSIVSLSPTLDHIERAYDAIKYGTASPAPHIELTVPSLRWPALVPEGKHVAIARVQYAARTGALDSNAVMDAIDAALPGFSARVTQTNVLTPADLEERFALTDGAFTHGEMALDQILFMRPVAGWGRYAMPVDGLYLGGSGASPGPGVPGGAGWLAARAALA
jgi:phytoene dehydrogenase-like protein